MQITCSFADYIRLTAITYQSFGLDKKIPSLTTWYFFGRGIRIRTLNDGVRVRSVTVTLYLYILFVGTY